MRCQSEIGASRLIGSCDGGDQSGGRAGHRYDLGRGRSFRGNEDGRDETRAQAHPDGRRAGPTSDRDQIPVEGDGLKPPRGLTRLAVVRLSGSTPPAIGGCEADGRPGR